MATKDTISLEASLLCHLFVLFPTQKKSSALSVNSSILILFFIDKTISGVYELSNQAQHLPGPFTIHHKKDKKKWKNMISINDTHSL